MFTSYLHIWTDCWLVDVTFGLLNLLLLNPSEAFDLKARNRVWIFPRLPVVHSVCRFLSFRPHRWPGWAQSCREHWSSEGFLCNWKILHSNFTGSSSCSQSGSVSSLTWTLQKPQSRASHTATQTIFDAAYRQAMFPWCMDHIGSHFGCSHL